MTRLFTLAVAAALATSIGIAEWSHGGQSGGGGTSGNAGASGSAGASSGAAGTSGSTQASGTAGASGAAPGSTGTGATGTTAAAGVAPAAGAEATAPGTSGTGTDQFRTRSNVPGQRQFGTTPQPGFNFNGPSQTPFFTDPGARRQLNLNDNQFNTLNRAYLDSWNRFNTGTTNLGNNLTPEQRMQQMQQLEGQFSQQFGQTLDSTFTDPRVRNRFNQLNWQYQGYGAFNDPMVRQRLNITPQQQRQLRRLAAEWRERMQRLRRAGNDNPQLTQQQFAELQAQNMDRINSVLTPEQQQIWVQLMGERYNFPANAYLGAPAGVNAAVPPADTSPLRANTPQGTPSQGTAASAGTPAEASPPPTDDGPLRGRAAQGSQNQGAQGTQGTRR